MAASSGSSAVSSALLMKEYRGYQKEPQDEFSVGLRGDNIYKWKLMIVGPSDTPLEGGLFRATLDFPEDYPNNPPKMKFTSKLFHPNIYPDGRVCISILHPPGEDAHNAQEKASERWLPIHTVNSIVQSVILMLCEPNCDSPANVDAAVMYRDDPKTYKRRMRRCVEASFEEEDDD